MSRSSRSSTTDPAADAAATAGKPGAGRRAAASAKPRVEAASQTPSSPRPKGPVGDGGSPAPPDGEPPDFNVVVLRGRLSADPEVRTYDSGATALRLLVTVRATEPRKRVDVLPVTLWDPDRRLLRTPPGRGDRVWVSGSVHRRFWEGPDGRRSRIEVVADQVQPDGAGEPPMLPVGPPVAG